jgi:general secretion pathway protein H
MVIALAILALVAAIALPRAVRPPGPAEMRATADAITAALRADRNAAWREGRVMVTAIDLAAGRVRPASGGAEVLLPPGVAVELVQSGRERVAGGGGFRFDPDGRSSGGVLTFRRDGSGYAIAVNWLTAGISVTAAAEGS